MDTPTPDQINETPAAAVAPEPTPAAIVMNPDHLVEVAPEPTTEEAIASLESKLSTAHAQLLEARNQIMTSAMNGHGPSQAWLSTHP